VSEHIIRLNNGKQFAASPDSTLLDAAIAAGLPLEHGCRTGRCGSCKTRVLQGRTARLQPDLYLGETEHQQGWVLSCVEAARSDLDIDAEDLAALSGIVPRTLPARISVIEPLSEDVVRVGLRLPPGTVLPYLAGQYLNIIGHDGLRRSYSMANAPQPGGALEFYIRRVHGGAMSAYWFGRAAVNDLLRLDGPRGSFFLRQVAGRHVVLLATGTGIAPMKAQLQQLAAAPAGQLPRSIHLLWGGRTQADLFWTPDFPGLPLQYTPVLSRADLDWPGARGHVQQVLLQQAPELQDSEVYACGSAAMIAGARQALVGAGLAPARFHSDAFVSST
jgi:CDP-4-dehydro-6-deoxyglucose reductase